MVVGYVVLAILDLVVIFWIIQQFKLDYSYKKEKELENKVYEILRKNKII